MPSVEPFHLKKVLFWVPECIWPGIDHIPCRIVMVAGSMTNGILLIHDFLGDNVGYMIGLRCEMDVLHAKVKSLCVPAVLVSWNSVDYTTLGKTSTVSTETVVKLCTRT